MGILGVLNVRKAIEPFNFNHIFSNETTQAFQIIVISL
jgi:hypothetical protein